ncbi:T9SS type A sorting domain-containing protein [Flavobacterium psychroterrae]|uniref:T9SS type A sorting domain-containing protein n=1 Tax=Flavobacterium psychroterrae TaxID=2133767 RepID=A0ABS5PF93_9FLAO|nr:T9SS type A sorting domain-containing protein [Flavobacterium psychroterrae]MBS7232525.1 T9SS type A sorting domain-containing protein [Flavobacterium psychroterrae]
MIKKYLLLLLFCPLLSHSQDILWEKVYGGLNSDYLFDAQSTADYGFILAGSSLSNKTGNKENDNKGDLDYWIWKMNQNGDLDWQKSIGGSGFDLLKSIKTTADGGFILAGTSNSPNDFDKKDSCKGGNDFWVIKLNAAGVEQWQRTIGGSGQDELLCAFQTKDGGYMLGGSSSSSPKLLDNDLLVNQDFSSTDLYTKTEKSRGNMDYWIVKLDKTGVIEWQKTYGGEYADVLRSMKQTRDGGYILGGYSNSPQSGDKTEPNKGIGDYWIIKINNAGVIEWQQTYGGNGDNQLYVIHQTEDEGYIVGGNSNSTSPLTSLGGMVAKGTDYWVLKLDKKGNVIWSKTFDFGKTDILTSVLESKDHSYLIGGYSQKEENRSMEGIAGKTKGLIRENKEENGYIALKIDDKGEEIWRKTVKSNGEDVLQKLFETRDGGYLMAGTSKSGTSKDKKASIGGNDFWVVKLEDRLKPDKVKTKGIEAIPNPVVTFTNIIIGYKYENGTATVVDMAGRILKQFDITGQTIPVNLSNYPEGIYIVNIKTNVQSDGVKVIRKGKN